MNITLWIFQGIIAAIFLMAGLMKMTQTKEVLKEKVGNWVTSVSSSIIKLIGVLEVLGAIGVIVPMAFGFAPSLVSFAAVGLALTMVGATVLHLKRGESKNAVFNVLIMAIALFVAYGRMMF